MKLSQKLILGLGALMLLELLRRMDPPAVAALVLQVGSGFFLIIGQEILAHILNAAGWKFSYEAQDAARIRFSELVELRIAGDGVNYLTPTATIAGEFARASLLTSPLPPAVRSAGVVVAKCAQAVGQALFVLFGLAFFACGRAPLLYPYAGFLRFSALLSACALGGALLWLHAGRKTARTKNAGHTEARGFRAMAGRLVRYYSCHPARCALAVLFFLMGFAWGGFEAYWICRFLGVPVSAGTAMAVEVISCLIDSVCIIVPAKMGTQEAGKTAVFSMLGLPARAGFAFGIVRHLRELSWAVLGLGLYSARLKRGGIPEESSAGHAKECASAG